MKIFFLLTKLLIFFFIIKINFYYLIKSIMGNCQNFKSNDDPIHPSYQNKGQVPLQL